MSKEPVFRKPRKAGKLAVFICLMTVGVFVAFFGYRGYQLKQDKEELQGMIEELSVKVDHEAKRAEDLEEFETYTHTKKYAEEVAKDVMGYVHDGEIVFQPKE